MEARLHYIDAGGRLYRGYGREWPLIVWDPFLARWTKCNMTTPQQWDWGQFVTEREAERMFSGSTKARLPDGAQPAIEVDAATLTRLRPELFDDYDFGCTPRISPQEKAGERAYLESVLPEKIRDMLGMKKVKTRDP